MFWLGCCMARPSGCEVILPILLKFCFCVCGEARGAFPRCPAWCKPPRLVELAVADLKWKRLSCLSHSTAGLTSEVVNAPRPLP